MANNLFTDYPDRLAHLEKYAKVDELVLPLEKAFGDAETFKTAQEGMDFYRSVLEELGRFTGTEVKDQAAGVDTQGVKLEGQEVKYPEALLSHLARFRDLGVFGSNISREQGGFNLPYTVQILIIEMIGHACPNTALTVAAYSMGGWVEKWASEDQKKRFLPGIIQNTFRTSMALTEPGAGSDLGKLRSTAKKDGDKWFVTGTKQFITNGDGEITFALVRTDPKSQGLEGLSIIAVPRKRPNGEYNTKVSKIEKKICLHASPTCELVFENSEGELFGPEGQGFKVMLDLMNAARLGMAALALGICQSAYDEAKRYAQDRVTMGKPIIQHPMVADLLYEMDLEIRAMRAMCVEAARAQDWMNIHEKNGNKKEFERWQKRYRRLTPLCKYLTAEKVILITRNAVQILGGYGVCTEYPVERFFRESIIFPIYEGTSQIQSLMVLKDTLKDVATEAPGFLGSLAGAWAESKLARDPLKSILLQARNELNQGIRTILASIVKDKFKSDVDSLKEKKIQDFIKEYSLRLLSHKTDLTYPFLVAERFTRITCDYYALKCLADNCDADDSARKQWILNYAELILPRMRLENHYMVNRLPQTLEYMKTL